MSFLEGETGVPAYIWQDEKPIIVSAKLLRDYHDATLDFAQEGAIVWGIIYPDASRHKVICHNDFAPYNFIFRDKLPYAIIDIDLVGPGPRLRDIAYAAYWLTPLSFGSDNLQPLTEADIQNDNKRLYLFCETYGVHADIALFDMVYEVLSFMGDKKHVEKVLGFDAALKLEHEGHLAHWQKEAQAFLENRSRLEANL